MIFEWFEGLRLSPSFCRRFSARYLTNGSLWLGDTTARASDTAEFTIRKIQIREGDVRREFALSPYDTQLIDGSVTSSIIQDAAITSAKVAEAAIGTAATRSTQRNL